VACECHPQETGPAWQDLGHRRATAEAVAVAEFRLDDQQRKRLLIEEVHWLQLVVQGGWMSGPSKRLQVYVADRDSYPGDCVGEFDSLAELRGFRWRQDKRYWIRMDGRWINRTEFLPRSA
jgi:hypothetical protein